MLTITTNNHERALLSWYELTSKEHAEFDYLDSQGRDDWSGFRYKGTVYSLADFMCSTNPELKGWDGFMSDTFFSGIVVRLTDDCDHVIVGRIYA